MDSDAALAELRDPDTSAARLMEIAEAHPELADAIIAHPNVYPGLIEWLNAEPAADAAPEIEQAAPATPVQPVQPASAPGPTAVAAAPFASPAPTPTTGRNWGLILPLILAGSVVLAVVAGVGTSAIGVWHDNSYNPSAYVDDGSGDGSTGDGTAQDASQLACPSGSTEVMWSQWDGGATIVCGFNDNSGYTMLVSNGSSTQQSNDVTATATGYDSSLADIELGGWVVWPAGASQSVAPTQWGTSSGASSTDASAPPSDIPACPGGSYAISLSVWNGGWLLTCGTSTDSMSSFQYQDGTESDSGGALSASAGGYCGSTNDGIGVCVNSAPALVQIGTGDATVQRSVASNYFAGAGTGGAGQGTGAYDVTAPTDTAKSQVGYLVAILQKSEKSRSKVNSALGPLNTCKVSSGDVQNLRDLADARSQLLDALDSTPVDQIPDGARILSQLKKTLRLSEKADNGYVSAGTTMSGGDCKGGRGTYRAALKIGDSAEVAKRAFVQEWNEQIAPTFGVRTFGAKDI
jgi:hypothetical protein